jgi:hypothetical protein
LLNRINSSKEQHIGSSEASLQSTRRCGRATATATTATEGKRESLKCVGWWAQARRTLSSGTEALLRKGRIFLQWHLQTNPTISNSQAEIK